jgi:hypothetical protein
MLTNYHCTEYFLVIWLLPHGPFTVTLRAAHSHTESQVIGILKEDQSNQLSASNRLAHRRLTTLAVSAFWFSFC